jgi:hypothetical protein
MRSDVKLFVLSMGQERNDKPQDVPDGWTGSESEEFAAQLLQKSLQGMDHAA